VKEIALDARELAHPEPLVQATRILPTLDDTSYLYMLHRKNPIPLVDLASGQGFNVLTHEDKEGNWHILINTNPHVDLKGLLRV
jgi:hypothetical protein